ncbi:STAS domain-containing protein [Kitasatospora sp. DSM 101779]|uniref:STAS domain-containing protein n=1 Tax=Kitasatospora sp. DSM 101779 TaxID=2853165 RepID=UPI0021D9A84A|nr:STAS domain-containing protein [Kitasatospora sp. DSM 101779]MCU7820666.1 STAS domain-containing protein [Kitasatospora sp. DSM 101779]
MTDDPHGGPLRDPSALEMVCDAVGDDGALCRVTGTLTAASLLQAGQGLDLALRTGRRLLVLDLARVLVCDSAAMDYLLQFGEDARAAGVRLRLSAASPAVSRVLDETGRRAALSVYDSVEEAMAAAPEEAAEALNDGPEQPAEHPRP